MLYAQELSRRQITQILGLPTDGMTIYQSPVVNFTANDDNQDRMLETKIFELGNSLGFVTGQVTLQDLRSGKVATGNGKEPGEKLLDCYKKGGPTK